MKYTSRLKEAALEHKHCKNCKSLLSCQNNMKGYCLTPNALNNSINFSYQKCEYKEKNDLHWIEDGRWKRGDVVCLQQFR